MASDEEKFREGKNGKASPAEGSSGEKITSEPEVSKKPLRAERRETSEQAKQEGAAQAKPGDGDSDSPPAEAAGETVRPDAEGTQTAADEEAGTEPQSPGGLLDMVKKVAEGQEEETQDAVAPEPEAPKADGKGLSDAEVDETVEGINEIANRTVEEGSLEIGELVVERRFRNDPALARSKDPTKDVSIRKIAQHPDLLLSPQRLSECVRAAATRRWLIQEGIEVDRLCFTQFLALSSVKDEQLRGKLAEKANTERCSVRDLKDEIESHKPKKLKPATANLLIKSIQSPVALLSKKSVVELCSDKNRLLRDLNEREREKVLGQIEAVKRRIDDWSGLIGTLEEIIRDIMAEEEPADTP